MTWGASAVRGEVFASPPEGAAEARKRVAEILERHTAFRWGEDCLVWMVHYPQELVEPWVAVEAAKRGLGKEDAAQYRDSFVRDLRLGELEPFLFTVYVFGDTPVSLQPFKDRVALVTASGTEVPPVSFEGKLDGALSGIVQGLIFFPRQAGGDFTVRVRPGEMEEPLRFAFAGGGVEDLAARPGSSDIPREVVVARVPAPEPVAVATPLPPEKPSRRREKPSPTPLPPVEPPPAFLVLPPAHTAGASPEMPQEIPDPTPPPPSPRETPPPEAPTPPPAASSPERPPTADGKDRLVAEFLKHWVNGDGEKMYALLAEQSRTLNNPKDFAAQVRQDSFRWALKDGYKLAWLDDGTVRVSAAQKLLVMRVLKTHILRVVREQGGWRVAW